MRNVPVQVDAANHLRQAELSHAVNFAALIAFLTIFFTAFFGITGMVLALPAASMQQILLGAVGFGGFVSTGIVVWGWRRGSQHISNIVNEFLSWSQLLWENEERKHAKEETAAPPAPPALPPVTSGVAAPILIGGFDKSDLRALCNMFAAGKPWTEGALMGKPLPRINGKGEVVGEVLSRVRYKSLMDLFVGKGIIVDRGGPGNKPGRLAVKDAAEMMRILCNESPALSPTSLPQNDDNPSSSST